jgi:hypothetical protein
MNFFKNMSGASVVSTLSIIIAARLAKFGKRFGYILIVTEQPPGGEPLFHMIYNGYGAQGSAEANAAAAEILDIAGKIMRGEKVAP